MPRSQPPRRAPVRPALPRRRPARGGPFLAAVLTFALVAQGGLAQNGPTAVRTGPPPLATPWVEGATLSVEGLADDERLIVLLAHGESILLEDRLGPAERIEVDAMLALTPTLRRPCDDGAPSVHLAHRTRYASGSGRGASATCLRASPASVRAIDLAAWRTEGEAVPVPHDVWLPIVAAELRPQRGLSEMPDDLFVAWAIVATDPDLPPLPVPDHPERLRSDLRLHLPR